MTAESSRANADKKDMRSEKEEGMAGELMMEKDSLEGKRLKLA